VACINYRNLKYTTKNKESKKRTSTMMEYEEDLNTTQLDDYEDDADDATEM
jgi:hypothetical protein